MRYIIGLGNYSMADDGIGLRLVEHIVENGLDRGFEAVAIADEGMRLLFYLKEETEKIVLIDTVDLGLPPGGYRLFKPEDVESTKDTKGFTTHEGDILKILELARSLVYPLPPITILGIQPAALSPGMELSAELQDRFPAYLRLAIKEVQRDG